MSQSRARTEARRAARRAKDDGSGKRPSGDPIAIVRRVIDLEVDPNGDTVPLDLSVYQLLAVGQLAAKLAELQQTEYRDGLELARLALEHQTPTDPASTDAGSTTNEGATK